MTVLRWIVSAALAAVAAKLVVIHATPVDAALPFLAVAVTLLASRSYPGIMLGVPLLLAAEIAIVDETARLLAFGLVMASAFFAALVDRRDTARGPAGAASMALIAVTAVAILRWIPIADVDVSRELVLLALSAAIVLILGSTPLAAAVAVTVALFTHFPPSRSMWLPFFVLVLSVVARIAGIARVRLAWPSAVVVATAVFFFAWSGVLVRALPWMFGHVVTRERVEVGRTVGGGESIVLDVPQGARSLIVSGAHVATFEEGTVLGRMDPGGRLLSIGSVADWGYMRRDYYARSKNPLPRDAAGTVHDYGYSAWVDGAGRIALPRDARRIRVTGDPRLPSPAVLQIEAFELAE